jgi:hypothetical protein
MPAQYHSLKAPSLRYPLADMSRGTFVWLIAGWGGGMGGLLLIVLLISQLA